jgi:hypothetical protein
MRAIGRRRRRPREFDGSPLLADLVLHAQRSANGSDRHFYLGVDTA